jgi:hypothetical protein
VETTIFDIKYSKSDCILKINISIYKKVYKILLSLRIAGKEGDLSYSRGVNKVMPIKEMR